MSEVIVACFVHCRLCCPHHGAATEEACSSRWHVTFRERMAVTQNYYAGAATPAPELPTVVEGHAVCLSCGHAMERAACHDRCDSCGALLDGANGA